MKIMQLIHSEKIGGVYSISNGIFSNWLNKENMFMFVLRARKPESNGITNKYVNRGQNFIEDLRNLKNYINANQITIVHCHAIWQGLLLLLILKFFRLIRVKIIFHQHAQFKRGAEYDFRSFFMTKFLLRFVDKCLAVSEITKEYLMKNSLINKEKIHVLQNFVSPGNLGVKSIVDSETIILNKHDFKVGFAGRIVPLKDWRTFIESYSFLSEKLRNNISYYIAGGGYEQKLLQKYLDSNPNLKVYFLGPLENMESFYKSMDLFVSCSLQESFGLSIVEAQMLGVPVISSAIEGISSVVSDGVNGLLFTPQDPDNLATKIEKVYADKELQMRLAKNGKESASQFDKAKYLTSLNEIYQSLS